VSASAERHTPRPPGDPAPAHPSPSPTPASAMLPSLPRTLLLQCVPSLPIELRRRHLYVANHPGCPCCMSKMRPRRES
jgi:hypothetical protein